jgi:hypothetical protein
LAKFWKDPIQMAHMAFEAPLVYLCGSHLVNFVIFILLSPVSLPSVIPKAHATGFGFFNLMLGQVYSEGLNRSGDYLDWRWVSLDLGSWRTVG